MTLSYRKANALVHDTYFLSFKGFFYRSLCEEKIHCVRARLSPERIILLFYSFESVTRFFMWFSSLPQQLDWIFILPNQVFWLLFNQTVGKNRRNQNQNNFFPRYNFRPQKSKIVIHISGSIQKGASSLRSWWRLTTSQRRTMPTMSSTATSWPQSFRYDQWYR